MKAQTTRKSKYRRMNNLYISFKYTGQENA
jgi:hypothetical protein